MQQSSWQVLPGSPGIDALAQQPSPRQVSAAFVDGERGDAERDGGVGPPQAEGGVERQAGEDTGGEVGAEHVLRALAGGRA